MAMQNEQRLAVLVEADCVEQSKWGKLIDREFRHFKGGHYRLEGFDKDFETLEPMVVYPAFYGEGGGMSRQMIYHNGWRLGQ